MSSSLDARLHRWGPRAVALAAFALLAWLTPAGRDAPLIAAGAGLGTPASSASPLWSVLAHVASLLPLGEHAWRLQLLSAAAGGLAALWTARLVIAVGRDDAATAWGAITAAALLAVALLFVRVASAPGVVALTVALLAAAGLGIERVAAGAGARWGLGLAVICGLGLATHPSFVWIGPVVGALLVVRLRRGARFPLAAPAMTALVATLLLALLPLRAAGHGDAEAATLSAVIDAVDGGLVRGDARVRDFAADLADSLGPFGAIAAAIGVAVLWRRRRTWWTAALVTSIAPLAALWQHGAILCWVLAIAAGVAVASLVRLTGRFAAVAGAPVAALCVVPAAVVSLL